MSATPTEIPTGAPTEISSELTSEIPTGSPTETPEKPKTPKVFEKKTKPIETTKHQFMI